MIPAEPEAAETMTLALARVYRRVLGAADKDLHPLADELELVSAFLEVERGRFADRLRFCVEVDPELSPDRVPVPVLCLQPFVENAVKHGLSSLSGGGTVWVRASRRLNAWELSVEDDGVGLGKARPSTGSGTAIANFRARLLLLYQGKAAFEVAAREPTGTRVTVRIPA